MRYPADRLMEEMAYIAYHFHWSSEQIMALEHWERQQWVAQISQINQQLNQGLTNR